MSSWAEYGLSLEHRATRFHGRLQFDVCLGHMDTRLHVTCQGIPSALVASQVLDSGQQGDMRQSLPAVRGAVSGYARGLQKQQ